MFSFTAFNCLILFFVTVDFLITSNRSPKISAFLTIFWITLGVSFSFYIYLQSNDLELVYEYLGAYFIEKSLSLDNIFVFLMIFSKFGIEPKHQHKVLFIGLWSALFFRYLMIFVIGEIVNTFHFMIPTFGVLLFYTGVRSMKRDNVSPISLEKFFKKFSKYISVNHEGHFFVKIAKKWKATILVLVLLIIEISDIVFSFDSIPAIFSITSHKDIVYSSNAFAVIGLRSLYGVFSSIILKKHFLKYAVNIILCAVGAKMILSDVISIGAVESLAFILIVLIGSYLMSLREEKKL